MLAIVSVNEGGHHLLVVQDPQHKDVLHVHLFHALFDAPIATFVLPIHRFIEEETKHAAPKKATE